jgi:hypothetical protein
MDRTGADRLIWILSYDGDEGFERRDEEYYASPKREALDPDPSQWIVANETYFIEPV